MSGSTGIWLRIYENLKIFFRNGLRFQLSIVFYQCFVLEVRVTCAIKMEKKKNIVWNFFKKIIDKRNKASFKCKYCDQMYRKHATRQKEHLKKCIYCPETVKQFFKLKRNLCEENLNYLFFMFEFNIMAIKNFFLILNSDKALSFFVVYFYQTFTIAIHSVWK